MLLKLMKYEFRSIARTLTPLYLATLAVSLLAGVMGMGFVNNIMSYNSLLGGLPYMLVNLIYFGLMVALFACTLIIVIQRFYKGLLSDEGYLMFTLPVRSWELITAKGVVAVVMSFLTGLVAMISICILAGFYGNFNFSFLGEFFSTFAELTRLYPQWIIFALEFLILMAVGGLASILMLYACMALGHTARRHRAAMSFVWYVVLYVAYSFLSGLILDAFGRSGFDYWLVRSMSGEAQMHVLMWILIAFCAVQGVVYFFLTNTVLTKRLNLE